MAFGIGKLIGGLVKPVTGLYANRQERLKAESDARAKLDEIMAEAAAKDSQVAGQIALVNAQNQNSTWKDEYALIVISGPFVVSMLAGALEAFAWLPPGTAGAVITGMFSGLDQIPQWWATTFQAGMLGALGITQLKKLRK